MGLLDFAGPIGNLLDSGASLYEGHKNRGLQRDALKKGIQWRVRDAQMAGIHPLFALGAQTNMPAPISTDFGFGRLGESLASVGDRAVNARHAAMSLELMAQQIRESKSRELVNITDAKRQAFARQGTGGLDVEPRNMVFPPSVPFRSSDTSSAQMVQDEYGDVVEAVYGIGRLLHDIGGNAARSLGPYHSGDSAVGRSRSAEASRRQMERFRQNPRVK